MTMIVPLLKKSMHFAQFLFFFFPQGGREAQTVAEQKAPFDSDYFAPRVTCQLKAKIQSLEAHFT